MSKIKVVHYINQFYGGIGGEDKAEYPAELKVGEFIGPGQAFQSYFGEQAEIIATIICGDVACPKYMKEILDWVKKLNPDVVIAGPVFNDGLYGFASGFVCSNVQHDLGIPAITGMYKENHAVDEYKDRICIFPTTDYVSGMKEAVEMMAPFALKVGRNETVKSAEVEGYIPKGYIPLPSEKEHIKNSDHERISNYIDFGKKYETTPTSVSQPKPTIQPNRQKPQSEFKSSLVLKKTNFNSALNKIADFANSSVAPIKFRSVEEDSFIIFDRDVTGREFNRFLTKELLPQLEIIQENQQKTIREFSSVYRTFDSLDKDYIAGIVHAVQSAEKASYQAVEASEQAKDASDEALKAQRDNTAMIEALGKTVEKLCKFEHENSAILQKVKIAYILAGSAVGISLLHIILKLTGVL